MLGTYSVFFVLLHNTFTWGAYYKMQVPGLSPPGDSELFGLLQGQESFFKSSLGDSNVQSEGSPQQFPSLGRDETIGN